MRFVKQMLALSLAVAASGSPLLAQSDAPAAPPKTAPTSVRTFYLANVASANDATEILTSIRSVIDPRTRIFLDASQNAIVVEANAETMKTIQMLIDDLDRPKKTYRLTYTITEVDGTKRVGTQHYSMVLLSGQRTTMKQGNKVPVATGTYETGSSTSQTQFTYLDVGLNFDATLTGLGDSASLLTKVEQSSLAADKTIANIQEPVVRQTVLEGASILTPGKPLILGSLDIPDSTRRLDIAVVMEVVK
jgi:type II secretory pathway component GspD/PulD (secretin)